jgi:hypothetical protein
MHIKILLLAALAVLLHGCGRQTPRPAAPPANTIVDQGALPPSSISVEALPRDKFVLTLRSYRSQTPEAALQELGTRVTETCAPKTATPLKYDYEAIKDLSGPYTGHNVIVLRQHIWCKADAEKT